ncbi:MAG: flagellin [Burkholderiaceae bacterium]
MSSMINTNLPSLNAQNNLNKSQSALTTSLQRLSSGLRINSAKDDAAGMAISDRMTSQIRGTDQASRNANDAISLSQTAEGDLSTISDNLQRMRELAVQSANASNSNSDRVSIDNEVQSLSAEIDRVAQNSSFNGNKLLDGSFVAQNFQVGANATANDTISVAIGSARTSALGGVGTSSAATLAGGATTAALAAGDMTLNGSSVGASVLGAGPGQSAASAYSVANAINAISASSGVTATANANVVAGTSAPTAFTAITATASFSINGIDVGAISAGGNAAGQGANVAAAINKIATQTGVSAAADATTGKLTLTATDGRDISITMNGSAADSTTAGTNKTTLLAQTGLATGVVGTQASAATPTTSVVSGAYTASIVGTALDAGQTATGTFTIDGVTAATNTTAAAAASGAVILSAAQLDTQVTAFVGASNGAYTLTGTFAAGTAKISKADGTALVLNTTATVTSGAGSATNGTFAGGTGFTTTAAGGPAAAATAAANHGTVTLNSTSASGIVYGGAKLASAGFTAGSPIAATVTSSVKSIASVNVLTAANATSALSAIDGALSTINASRAALGSYQNRFASVVSNLQTTSENLTASRSRIQDTDFAKETASLTRGQILQQAGTAMLAQANSLPNGVMTLLRG